jgi:hypothetical protein
VKREREREQIVSDAKRREHPKHLEIKKEKQDQETFKRQDNDAGNITDTVAKTFFSMDIHFQHKDHHQQQEHQ